MSKKNDQEVPPWRRLVRVVSQPIKIFFYLIDDVSDIVQNPKSLVNAVASLIVSAVCYCVISLFEFYNVIKGIKKLKKLPSFLQPLNPLLKAMYLYIAGICGVVLSCGAILLLKLSHLFIPMKLFTSANFIGAGLMVAISFFYILMNLELLSKADKNLESCEKEYLAAKNTYDNACCMPNKKEQSHFKILALDLASPKEKQTKMQRKNLAGDLAEVNQQALSQTRMSQSKTQYMNAHASVTQYRTALLFNTIELVGYSMAFAGFVTGQFWLSLVGVLIGVSGKLILPALNKKFHWFDRLCEKKLLDEKNDCVKSQQKNIPGQLLSQALVSNQAKFQNCKEMTEKKRNRDTLCRSDKSMMHVRSADIPIITKSENGLKAGSNAKNMSQTKTSISVGEISFLHDKKNINQCDALEIDFVRRHAKSY